MDIFIKTTVKLKLRFKVKRKWENSHGKAIPRCYQKHCARFTINNNYRMCDTHDSMQYQLNVEGIGAVLQYQQQVLPLRKSILHCEFWVILKRSMKGSNHNWVRMIWVIMNKGWYIGRIFVHIKFEFPAYTMNFIIEKRQPRINLLFHSKTDTLI